nr:TGS domain-containing protein [Acidimicrobiia bacterium]
MSQITISLPDGSARQVPAGTTAGDLAASIGRRLAKAAVAATADGEEVDLGRPLDDGARVSIITADTEAGRHVLRHSTAHVMAQAVTQLFPGAKFSIGPAIEHGFYYDFELPGGRTFNDDDLVAIAATMREIIAADQRFERSEVSAEEALGVFADQPYKVEIIQGVAANPDEAASQGAAGPVISVYSNGRPDGSAWPDLCRGPHIPTTK